MGRKDKRWVAISVHTDQVLSLVLSASSMDMVGMFLLANIACRSACGELSEFITWMDGGQLLLTGEIYRKMKVRDRK